MFTHRYVYPQICIHGADKHLYYKGECLYVYLLYYNNSKFDLAGRQQTLKFHNTVYFTVFLSITYNPIIKTQYLTRLI